MDITKIYKANENSFYVIINTDGNSSDSLGGTSHAFYKVYLKPSLIFLSNIVNW